MGKRNISYYTLDNGLQVILEPMKGVSSSSFYFLVPSGVSRELDGTLGSAALCNEMLYKGSGPFDSKEFSDACERIGLNKSSGPGTETVTCSGSLLSENLPTALELLRNYLLEPRFPEEELSAVKSLAMQDLASLEDEPASKIMEELSGAFYSSPFNRSTLGVGKDIEAMSIEMLREFHQRTFVPSGSVLAIAGAFEAGPIFSKIKALFSSWKGGQETIPVPPLSKENRSIFIPKDTAQVQIALAYPSAGVLSPEYYDARVAVNVLSGGMSGRLFVEVREKRGLVYRVGAQHNSARDRDAVFVFAGTTPQNAKECLQVMMDQLRSLEAGVSEEELSRAKVDLKTRLVMQRESTGGRAATLASDWWSLKRVRSVEEIKAGIDSVTSDSIVNFTNRFPVSGVCLASLGAEKLELPK